jgi:hypothetical protein
VVNIVYRYLSYKDKAKKTISQVFYIINMKNHEKKDFSKEDIIMSLVKMRVEKFATTKTMLDFLMKEIGYAQTYSYELIKISKTRINEIFKEEHEESFHNAMARLEEIIESSKNEKVRLEAQKEMNKLLGLHKPQKVDVTSNGKDLQIGEVIVKIIRRDEDL